MVFFNYALRKLNAKIVYYGPGLCGKTTNLAWIHDHFEGGDKGKMISLATEGDRTIFFDLLPLEIGSIRGMDVTLQLYTVPGQVHYNSTRQLVLRGADGVVFVADSQRAMQSSNTDSFKNLQENLLLQGISLDGFPLVLQFNKRDLRDIVPVEEMNNDLNRYTVPIFEATATQGVGVQETLEGIVKLVMRSLRERYEGAGTGPRTPATQTPSGAGAPVSVPATPPPAGQPPVVPPAASPPQQAAPPPAAPVAPVKPPPAEPAPAPTPAPAPQPPVTPPPVQAPVEPAPAPTPPPVAQPPVTPPPTVQAPDGDVFSSDPGAQTTDFSKTQGPEVFGQGGVQGFEDELNTDVYGDGTEGATTGLEGEPFGEIPTDPRMEAPPVDEISVAGTPMEPPVDVIMPDDSPPPPQPAAPVIPAEPEAESDDFELDFPESQAEPSAPVFKEPPFTDVIVAPEADDSEAIATAAPTGLDFYEDRIDAPSPFAPQPGDTHVVSPELFEQVPVEMPDVVGPDAEDAAPAVIEPPSVEAPPVVEEPADFEAGGESRPMDDLAAAINELGPAEPVVDSGFDPFAEPEAPPVDEPVEPEIVAPPVEPEIIEPEIMEPEAPIEPAAIEPAVGREVDVRAQDNSLHLRLQGTGAIVESGQVRELDIEVPVPGDWVGNRRVTLQLRLTLTPDSEDENDGSGGTA